MIGCVAGLIGRPRHRPGRVHAGKGYDYWKCRLALSRRGIAVLRIAGRGIESHERLGKLCICFERQLETHFACCMLAYSVICLRALERFC